MTQIKVHLEYYVSKRVERDEIKQIDLDRFKKYVEDESIRSEDDIHECLQDFLWEEDNVVKGEDEKEDWEMDTFYITDASEVIPFFDITCCSTADASDNYCKVCGKSVNNE